MAVPAARPWTLTDQMSSLETNGTVRAWHERILIPTYEAGLPDANPFFLEKRVYQGSSGAVYPYPVIESISSERALRDYDAVFLENEYLKIMILPELGGRVQMALEAVLESLENALVVSLERVAEVAIRHFGSILRQLARRTALRRE